MGWSNRIFRGRSGDVARGRPRDILGTFFGTSSGHPGDQYLPAGLVDKYNKSYHCSIGKKPIDAGYSVSSIQKNICK